MGRHKGALVNEVGVRQNEVGAGGRQGCGLGRDQVGGLGAGRSGGVGRFRRDVTAEVRWDLGMAAAYWDMASAVTRCGPGEIRTWTLNMGGLGQDGAGACGQQVHGLGRDQVGAWGGWGWYDTDTCRGGGGKMIARSCLRGAPSTRVRDVHGVRRVRRGVGRDLLPCEPSPCAGHRYAHCPPL